MAPDRGEGRPAEAGPARYGLISDTHGLLRDEVFALFEGVRGILHAGDVGDPRILDDLGTIAPVHAVWGNVDGRGVRDRAPEARSGTLAGLPFGLIHGHQGLRPERLAHRFPSARLIVHGHSHRPTLRAVGPVLLVNPGSAGPKRFGDPVTLALLHVDGGEPRIRHVDLETGEPLEP